jgi:hypothetical protein
MNLLAQYNSRMLTVYTHGYKVSCGAGSRERTTF